MAHRDLRHGELVLRVVYDGAPSAGKTTNVQRLHEGLLAKRDGRLESPGTSGRRTEWFDRREFFGGYLDGMPVRCELLSVPGQAHLTRRRHALLRDADAVVLVLDATRPETHAASYASLLQPGLDPARVVVQLNKCDLATPDENEVRRRLDLPPSTLVSCADAASGEGVGSTFLSAVRLATEHARQALSRGELPALERPRDAAALWATLHAEERPELPAHWHPVGEVVPLVVRRVLAAAIPSTSTRAWALEGSYEWVGAGFVVHHHPSWRFDDIDVAWRELAAHLGPHRFAVTSPTGETFVLTRDAPTLLEEVDACLEADEAPTALSRLLHAWEGLTHVRGHAVVRVASAACVDGAWVHLGLGTTTPASSRGLSASLRASLESHGAWPELWNPRAMST
ncbi:MAG: GTPase domain-containing protein [Sandaracinus sp.]|nr:GTPase domain-containing protein [Sandaracinus sp.]MCB9619740.1 GTPase domain-containing protein [Sandaracinus sp.]MCB9623332.1 GTPase domain-containing protein [Sandaracinus sp.]MCB9636988.1 GTPase domain-containing protein [Sandaracinus sp.]